MKLPKPTKTMMDQTFPFGVPKNGVPPVWFSEMLQDSGMLDANGDMTAPNKPVDTTLMIQTLKRNMK